MSKFYLGQIRDGNDVISVFVSRYDNQSVCFYDGNDNLLAKLSHPQPLTIDSRYRDKPPAFLFQIDSLWTDLLKNRQQIALRHQELELISKELGIDIKNILGTKSFALSQEIILDKTSSKQSSTNTETSSPTTPENPNSITDNVYAKSEIKLNKLVDDRYTLGSILGVEDPNATLICVDSCDITGGKGSNSQFSFLIKYPDGRIEQSPMLSQEDGTSPDRDIYASNRDGSDIDKITARSMYRVHSPLGDFMISATYGVTGTLDVQLGKRDITEQDFIAVPLEDQKYTRYVTKEVQELIDPERGIDHTHHMTEQVEQHMGNNSSADNSTNDSKNSNLEQTTDENYYLTVATEIWETHPEMETLYNDINGLARDLQKFILAHPDKTVEDFINDRVASCDHYDRHQHY